MNLQEFRLTHPEYNDLPDPDLASALHRKFYPDMEFGAFAEKIGYEAPQEKRGFLDWPSPTDIQASQGRSLRGLERVSNAQLVGAGRGLRQFGRGIKQAGMEAGETLGILDDGSADDYTRRIDQESDVYRQAVNQDGIAGPAMVGELAGGTLPYLAMPYASATLPARMMSGAASGGLIGGTTYIPEGGSRAQSAGAGAMVGGMAPAAIEGASRGVGKVVNAARGQWSRPETQKLLDLERQHGVPLQYPDIQPGPVANKVGTGLEGFPFVGTGGQRAKQHEKALTAAKRYTDSLAKRGEFIDDWAGSAKGSLEARAKGLKTQIGRQYDELERLADPLGDLPINKTIAALDDEIAKVSRSKIPDKGTLAKLQEIRDNLQSDNTFSALRDFRSDLGLEIKGFMKGENTHIGAKGVGVLERVRSAVDDDMGVWANAQGGEIYEKWRAADRAWRKISDIYREPTIAGLKRAKDPDDLYRKFLLASKNKPETLYQALGPSGQAAVKYGTVSDALERAVRDDKFSPAKFARYMEDRQRELGVFFKGADKSEVDGFVKLMRHAQRAGQYMENPPTGQRTAFLAGAGIGAGAFFEPAGTGAVYGSAYLTRQLFTSDAGKRFLLAASELRPGSPALQKLLDDVLPKLAAKTAAEASQP